MATVKDKSQRDFRLHQYTNNSTSLDFNQIAVGNKKISDDVTLHVTVKTDNRPIKKKDVEDAIQRRDLPKLRQISNFFFDKSGIYSRLCRYAAYLYRYDSFVVPVVYDSSIKDDKVIEGWYKSCDLLESSRLKRVFGDIALKVIKNGCYYGYKINQKGATHLQELPVGYCRSRYDHNGKPAVEFNIKYFDDCFKDAQYRVRVLKMFPKEFQKAYLSYKKGTLKKDFNGDSAGWFLLDVESAVKFNLSGSDAPLFIPVIPAILDLDEAQDIDREKMKQQLLKIIVQKMPLDKNGDMIFDTTEAAQFHSNAVKMIGRSIGVDVLTTFAEVDDIDLSDTGTAQNADQLEKVERSVYNEAGVSQMQFNTDGNIALEKSILNDEATLTNLLLQFGDYAQDLLKPFNKNPKRLKYKVQMLPTTIYNYKELSKLYKEQTMLGYSKLLPLVALGHDQTTIIASAYFENKIMLLDSLFVAPQMSSTITAEEAEGGRPELDDDKKSAKTIQNKEAEG